MSDLIRVTDAMIKAGCSQKGGWSRAQLRIIGISWPLKRGWKKAILNHDCRLTQDEYDQFLALKDKHLGKVRVKSDRSNSRLKRYEDAKLRERKIIVEYINAQADAVLNIDREAMARALAADIEAGEHHK